MLLGAAVFTALPAGAATTYLTPTSMGASITTPHSGPCPPSVTCTDSSDYYLIQRADPEITLTINLFGTPTSTTPDAAFTKDTTVALTVSGGGSLSTTAVTIPRNQPSWTFPGLSYSRSANGVVVTATISGKGKSSTTLSDTTDPFDVVDNLQFQPQSDAPVSYGTGPSNCLKADSTTPVCATILLPDGTAGPTTLTNGVCTGIAQCHGKVAQVLTTLPATTTWDHPATMIVKCYRTTLTSNGSTCGKGGVSSFVVYMGHAVTGDDFVASPPCPSKGRLPDPAVDPSAPRFCTDYVQSSRVGVDNLWMYVLFDEDLRGII